uniref:Uncharacterized protein n=1 Tax=Sphenodon punctatus TaxID=8508 RepID=A0A8D0GBQ1_SPHPU
ALEAIKRQAVLGSKLQCRKALTPSRLHRWICHLAQIGGNPAVQPGLKAQHQEREQLSTSEQDIRKAMKELDLSIKKLYLCLPNSTLCLVLLPGTNSVHGSLPGLGLMGIRETPPPAACSSARF